MQKRKSQENLINTLQNLGVEIECRKGEIASVDMFGVKAGNRVLALLAKQRHITTLLAPHAKMFDGSLRHLAQWRNLKRLACDCTNIKGTGLRYLHPDCSLTTLSFSGMEGSRERNLEFVWRHDRLVHLILSDTEINDEQVSRIGELKRLKNVQLSGTRVGDATASILGQSRSLRQVTLDDTRISDRGVAELARLQKLEVLHLFFCKQITDASVDVFFTFPNLRLLSVSETGISKKGMRLLRKHLPLL